MSIVKCGLSSSSEPKVISVQNGPSMQGEGDLARLIWTTVLLRRMRSAAMRAVRSDGRAPIETVVAARSLRHRSG